MSAGKNTYTYDAHTYHTKVPPQGIAELLLHYLPNGGLVFDPFAGSGMTGVAARANGYDCVLNELSPAACFIANRFTSYIEPQVFEAGVNAVLDELDPVRKKLYTTQCRECGRDTEILYTVWSYRVTCNHCQHEFLLWDHCRKYGRRVREHKILAEFPCPACGITLKKSTLQRTTADPVLIGYKCCKSGQQEVTHPLNATDLENLRAFENAPPVAEGFYPLTVLPEGVNLRQPAKHGLDRIDKLYTPRNLAAMSHLWKAVHRVEPRDLAAHLAFVFTSLYQRVTRLSEFRFWGGSGNTARFNVPYIFNEANVFVTFARKARTIQDHLVATAASYRGKAVVVCNSATSLDYLPDESIDLIFTDPPFGANINYSEMNILWESWLGAFTDNTNEAIINKVQGKDITAYQRLMTEILLECSRVLRPGHWLLLMFMNSSSQVWASLKAAITDAGFVIKKIDTFDKQHGTFKQFVSDNTAGFDLVLHCLKPQIYAQPQKRVTPKAVQESVIEFLSQANAMLPTNVYLHVGRSEEIDFRKLYSDWLSQSLLSETELLDFSEFRAIAQDWLNQRRDGNATANSQR
jgi:DNA modification methylase